MLRYNLVLMTVTSMNNSSTNTLAISPYEIHYCYKYYIFFNSFTYFFLNFFLFFCCSMFLYIIFTFTSKLPPYILNGFEVETHKNVSYPKPVLVEGVHVFYKFSKSNVFGIVANFASYIEYLVSFFLFILLLFLSQEMKRTENTFFYES